MYSTRYMEVTKKMSETTTAFFDSDYEDVDEMLLRALEHPFVVHLDFDTRIRVFRNQEIPHRLQRLRILIASGGKYDVVVNRTNKDFRNLYKRAEKEFFAFANDREVSSKTLRAMQSIYRYRKRELAALTRYYFKQAVLITGEYEPTEVSSHENERQKELRVSIRP